MAATQSYNVITYGAKPDGRTNSAQAFISAWSQACESKEPATIHIPKGKYLLTKLVFRGPCKNNAIVFVIDGTLLAPSDYRIIANAEDWIELEHVSNVSVFGGILDANGSQLWSCKNSGKNCLSGATSLKFTNSNNILIKGLTSLNSQKIHIVIFECQNVKLQGLNISASGESPNTDGIHVQGSSGVTILNSTIGTGDDCVSVGPATSNLWVQNVVCGPGHGISIGSLGNDLQENGVQNVTITSCTLSGTANGVRIKTWGRRSNSFAGNILFQHILMNNVQNPIVIHQNYCPHHNCPNQDSGVKISNVTYQDIHGSSATKVAVKLDCSKSNPCNGIKLEGVNLTYKNKPVKASCINTGGTCL
ncbi:hypothetical protein JCGZ_13539 [Jatropha curcas]|uniref:Polygalacturonase-like n=2 Tax=Jatropha curcas TaxID=180498 RepID=A0A067KAH0_JATCU|nr:hypothetical protein JCGZ_13539 [Jatropha curcas]